MCVHITNYHVTPDVHIHSQRVKEYSVCPVNDKLRSPVMPAALHINLAWSILNSYISPRSRLERNNARPYSTVRQQDTANVHNQSLSCHKYFKAIFITKLFDPGRNMKKTN